MLMAELGDRDFWFIDEIPPEIRALVNRLDLQCMTEDDGLLDRSGKSALICASRAAEHAVPCKFLLFRKDSLQ